MATRSRVGFKNPDGTVNASYVHFDGYLEGVGIALQYNHNNDSAAKKLGYAKGIRSIEADTPVSFYGDMENEVYESEDDFYNSYDVDYAYLYDPARGWLFASEEYDTPGFIELEDQLLADEIVPGSGERTDDISENNMKKLSEITTLGASKAMQVGKKLGWNVTKKKVGRTDYVTFHKMGRKVGPLDATILTKDNLMKKLTGFTFQELKENTNDDLHDQLNDMMRDMDGEDLDDFLAFYAPEIDNTDANAITDWVYNLDDNDVLTIITDLQDYAELGLKESGEKLDIDAENPLEDEAILGLEENILKKALKNTASKKYMFNPILGLAGAVYDKVMGKLDDDKIKDEDDLIDSINADPKLTKQEKLSAIEYIKKDPELAQALVGDNDDFDWASYEDEQKKSKSFANFMGKWFNKLMTGDTLIQGNFLDPIKILDKIDARKNKKDPDFKSGEDAKKEKESKAKSIVDKKRKEMSDEEVNELMVIPPMKDEDEHGLKEEGIETETKKLKKIAQALKKASKSHGQQAKEIEKSLKEIHDPVRGNTLREHFNRFK